MENKIRRVVVTGMGAITPVGNNIDEYWQSLKNGVNGSKVNQLVRHIADNAV